MPPKPFYEVQPSAYLFVKYDGDKPEEKVRQWALFELLSTYGVFINNIVTERPVKVGTRTHRADIVVLRDGAPYVVIECKKWGAKLKGRRYVPGNQLCERRHHESQIRRLYQW